MPMSKSMPAAIERPTTMAPIAMDFQIDVLRFTTA